MTGPNEPSPVFTPGNEPYLGMKSVLWFDRIICWSTEANASVAAWTQENAGAMTPLQRAACQVLPQGVGIALSIRELIRQAYLFSAMILVRPLVERAAVISYLDDHPSAIPLWEDGWRHGKRPSLASMLASMAGGLPVAEAQKVCGAHNHMVHGDPTSSYENLVNLGGGRIGYASGKMLDSPRLCDGIAMESQCYLIVLTGRMSSVFPDVEIRDLDDFSDL